MKKYKRIILHCGVIAALTACGGETVAIQKQYAGSRDECQQFAEVKTDWMISARGIDQKDKNAKLVELFNNCMTSHNWDMGKVVVADKPAAPATPAQPAQPVQPQQRAAAVAVPAQQPGTAYAQPPLQTQSVAMPQQGLPTTPGRLVNSGVGVGVGPTYALECQLPEGNEVPVSSMAAPVVPVTTEPPSAVYTPAPVAAAPAAYAAPASGVYAPSPSPGIVYVPMQIQPGSVAVPVAPPAPVSVAAAPPPPPTVPVAPAVIPPSPPPGKPWGGLTPESEAQVRRILNNGG